MANKVKSMTQKSPRCGRRKSALMALLSLGFIVAACRSPESSDLKIIGGTPVSAKDPLAKRVAMLMDEDGSVVCSVAPVSKDVFVTAAHCVYGLDISGWTIRTGLTISAKGQSDDSTSYARNDSKSEVLHVARPMEHSEYSRTLLEVLEPSAAPNDVALIKTMEPSGGTIPVPILLTSSRWRVESDLPIVVAGYGRTDPSDPTSSGILEKVELKVSKVNKSVMEFTATDSHGKMGCRGDSGGPAFMVAGKQVWLVGIVSRGDRPCEKGTTVFTDLTEFWPFLEEAQKMLNFQLFEPHS